MARAPRIIPGLNAKDQINEALLNAVGGETNENPIGLADFCESTLSFFLHQWQRDYLCPILERFRTEQGLRIVLHAPSQLGKCVKYDTLIPLSDGSLKMIKDIEVGDEVLSVDTLNNIVTQKVSAKLCNGVQPLRRITFLSGRSIELTGEHPIYDGLNWIEAKELKPNQGVAAPTFYPQALESLPEGIPELIGYITGDGSFSSDKTSICISNVDPDITKHIYELADLFNWNVRFRDKRHYYFSGNSKSIRSPMKEMLQFIPLSKSVNKVVPDCIWKANNKDVAKFLGTYFNCDGSIGKNCSGDYYYAEYYSSSKQLLIDVQNLLKRFGIFSSLRYKKAKCQTGIFDSWRLSMTADSIEKFYQNIPLRGAKKERFEKAHQAILSRNKTQNYCDRVPEIWKNHLKKSLWYYTTNKIVSCDNKLKVLGTPRWKVDIYAKSDDNPILTKVCNPDIIWEHVLSNEEVEPGEVYDLEIDGNHNFVANGLVVHNSIIVSQRLPAWLMGCNPQIRVGLASFNLDHSTAFGAVVRDLMADESYERLFPNSGCRLYTQGSANVSAKLFSTRTRYATKDGQFSFVALGMQSSFTGKGLDTLIIDDPYASAEEARSEAINERTWRWWEETASPRIPSTSNVLVVYHRYSLDDLGARLLAQGGWTNVRFPMLGDDNVEGDDPTTYPSPNPMRGIGDLLSPIRDMAWVEQQRELAPSTYFAMFQGRPQLGDATLFDVKKLRLIPKSALPQKLSICRSYDFAASQNVKSDWTVGCLMGIDQANNNTVYIIDVIRERKLTAERDDLIKATANKDGKPIPVVIPEDPAAAGKSVVVYLTQQLAGFIVEPESVAGDKVTKATPLAGQVNIGNVILVEGSWNEEFIKEFRSFPLGKHDDQVDACAQGFNYLTRYPRVELATSSLVQQFDIQPKGKNNPEMRSVTDEQGHTMIMPKSTIQRFNPFRY